VKIIAYLSARREVGTPVVRAVHEAAAACDARLVRLGETFGQDPGAENDLSGFLKSADIIVAHVPHFNANVLFELGFAHGLGKPIIIIAPASVNLPIDLRGERTISYDPKPDVAKLSFALKEWLQELNRKSEGERRQGSLGIKSTVANTITGLSGRALEGEVAKALSTVAGWEVQASEENREGAFDFIIWNQQTDAMLAALGNPIAVEVKSRAPPLESVRKLVELTKRQGLKAVLLIIGSPLPQKLRRSIGSMGNRRGVIVLALDREDIESIYSPDDFPRILHQRLIDLRLT
jgi:hypothetical protein